LGPEPFWVIAPTLPNGQPAQLHLSISDATGDSAIFEYIHGKLVIHHSKRYQVMTNSPMFADQLALNAYWEPAYQPISPLCVDRPPGKPGGACGSAA
jgi:choloylglycine hydrolase